ncbi:MAG: bifunctional [glutamine synthetase] adenylyltransferase/[glutamine synthetase]-adenylyl-L-tyrosine phosphorylase [Alphaproteobacteria bacterium]|nr:bifunctional [glutamine synthetase] adenylyltransferase/[glutamine synthetase]-adenylyl-L-tyrosine phosphorylase [Alphaproteobacteria bacterium]
MTDAAQTSPFAEQIKFVPRVYDEAAADRLEDATGAAAGLSPAARGLLRAVGGCSPYLSRLIQKAPARYGALMAAPPRESLAAVIEEAGRAGDLADREAQSAALRAAKDKAALLIALAEIAGVWTSLEAGAALSDFADAAVNAALRGALRGLASKGFAGADAPAPEAESGIAVLAMGKLGARELNYSSDIDLIVVFDPSAPALGDPMSAREIAVAAARQLVRMLNEQTPAGYVFRTDLRLRPDPGVSAAAVSVRAAEAYYEAHGQNWERAAFIKARACAGDIAVGEALLGRLRPFVWRKYLDFAAIEDIHSIKRQIHASKGGETIEFSGHDIKTGRGGIREIEFLAQTQQLILGGKDPSLRPRATLDALDALAAAGRLDAAALREISGAYRYLRKVEHRLQMINDEQTHRIPRDSAGVDRLAAFLGESDRRAFETNLMAALRTVHRRFAELFEREERLSGEGGSLIFTGVENDPATLETLAGLGFQRPADISNTIRRWHAGALRATRSARARELLTKLVPRLLEALSKADDPDAAFVAFDDFLARLPAGVQVFSLFANNPHVFDVLIRIMTISPYLGRALSRRASLMEAMVESEWPTPAEPPEALSKTLSARLAGAASFEEKLNEARRWGGEQKFEIAAQLVIGAVDAQSAAAQFTAVADAALGALLPVAAAEIERAHGKIGGGLSVIAMGRLGAGTLTAASDLDLVFVYDAPEDALSAGPKPLDPVSYYLRLVRRLLTALSAATEEGALYEVDMQLRPSGSKGPWAVSLNAFERYYETDAWTWEEMALSKARVVAGDRELGQKVEAAIKRVLTRPREAGRLAADIRDMRERVANAKPAASVWDLKHAEGGLVDLEFTLAYLALRDGARFGAAPAATRAKIEFLRREGSLSETDAAELSTAFEMFETVMQVGRAAVGDQAASAAEGGALRARLAAALGAATTGEAEERLKARLGAVRRIFETVVISSASASKVTPGP